ncbi:MAG: ferritin-like domain-containing protein [Planctomycetota bacterium]|nr:MAG: ferritin-like domain-containing protein [Planctomycetota bacterium]
MKVNTLEDLLVHELRDLYSAEKQLTRALPKMAKATSNDDLARLFREHLEETHEHLERLETVLSDLGKSTRGPACKGMEGLLAEADDLLDEVEDESVKNAALVAAAQRAEHYEIAGYGTARTYAQLLGIEDAAELLQRTLDEEHAADVKLTKLAVDRVNQQAQGANVRQDEEAQVE